MILFCLALMLATKFVFFPYIMNPIVESLGSMSVELGEYSSMYSELYSSNSWAFVSVFCLFVVVNVHLAMKTTSVKN